MIDNFRGLAMMYVVFIHCLFWANFFPDTRSLFLVEMPFFFSITGMAMYFSHAENTISFYLSRLKRILIPYWLCGLLYCVLNVGYCFYKGAPLPLVTIIYSWFNPMVAHVNFVPYLSSAMWFVPVYLLTIFLLPFLQTCNRSPVTRVSLMLLALLVGMNYLFTFELSVPSLVQQTLFYAIWVYFGLVYMKHLHGKAAAEKLRCYLPYMLVALPCLVYITGGGNERCAWTNFGHDHASQQISAKYCLPAL